MLLQDLKKEYLIAVFSMSGQILDIKEEKNCMERNSKENKRTQHWGSSQGVGWGNKCLPFEKKKTNLAWAKEMYGKNQSWSNSCSLIRTRMISLFHIHSNAAWELLHKQSNSKCSLK